MPQPSACNSTPQPDRPKPANYLVGSILMTIFCCQILGIVSIIYSIQVDQKWKAGDYIGAEEASRNARIWLLLGTIVGFILLTTCFVVSVFLEGNEGLF